MTPTLQDRYQHLRESLAALQTHADIVIKGLEEDNSSLRRGRAAFRDEAAEEVSRLEDKNASLSADLAYTRRGYRKTEERLYQALRERRHESGRKISAEFRAAKAERLLIQEKLDHARTKTQLADAASRKLAVGDHVVCPSGDRGVIESIYSTNVGQRLHAVVATLNGPALNCLLDNLRRIH